MKLKLKCDPWNYYDTLIYLCFYNNSKTLQNWSHYANTGQDFQTHVSNNGISILAFVVLFMLLMLWYANICDIATQSLLIYVHQIYNKHYSLYFWHSIQLLNTISLLYCDMYKILLCVAIIQCVTTKIIRCLELFVLSSNQSASLMWKSAHYHD